MPSGDRGDPFNSMKFVVEIDGIPTSAFLAASGIEADVAVVDYRPGNDKVPGARKLPGEVKFTSSQIDRWLAVALCMVFRTFVKSGFLPTVLL
jgi:phage tail-like protein